MRGYGEWVQCEEYGKDYHQFEPAAYPRVHPLCDSRTISMWDYDDRRGKRAPRGGRVCEECKRLAKED